MGTYTTNYNLYMPTIGETGWGTLINGNYQTIDSTMKGLSNRITAVENEVNGNLSCTTVTTSGKVTANGGITSTTGTFSGAVTAAKFNGVVLKSSGIITVTPNNTVRGYLPTHGSSTISSGAMTILPPKPGVLYSGSLKFKNTANDNRSITYWTGATADNQQMNLSASSTITVSFSNVSYFAIHANNTGYVQFYDFTFS